MREEGLDIIGAQYVPNLRTVDLKPWPRRGGAGVYINHDASRTSNDCYVCAIPPGKKLEPQRQLYEEMILILDGRGATTVWNDAGKRITFEWKAGAMFAIPLNCWHQHFNGSGQEPARYVGVTNAPSVMNLYDDINFIFNTPYDFKDRFNGEPDYFTPKAEKKGFLLATNFVRRRGQPAADQRQGARRRRRPHPLQHVGRHAEPHLAVPGRHLQEGALPRAERPRHHPLRRGLLADVARGPGAAALRLARRHLDRAAEPHVPPALQHRADAGALSRLQARGRGELRNSQGVPIAWISQRIGGDQIDYADEKPEIRSMFADALAKHGVAPKMDDAYAAELPDLPPKLAQREAAE